VRTSPPRVPALLVAAALIGVESLTAVVFAVLEAGQIRPGRAGMGVGVTLIMLGYGALLALVARGVFRGRRWSRGPAVVTQLILLLLGYSFRQPPTSVAGLLMAVVALTALVCLLVPSATRTFVGEDASGSSPPGR
jgi:peptidoglycan/LPS O-acetylase OafA/YrhL